MINKIIHFSDLHLRLFKEHQRYREVLTECFRQWKNYKPRQNCIHWGFGTL